MSRLRVYLAGAIRGGNAADIEWRERVIAALYDYENVQEGRAVDILSPLGGKTYDAGTKMWDMSGVVPVDSVIVPHDFWAIDRADICVFNFRALSEGYPNIGTLIEFGRATKAGCLIYSIVDPAYTGHEDAAIFKAALHPFIQRNSAVVFATVDDCVRFMKDHVRVLSGDDPHFGGTIGS